MPVARPALAWAAVTGAAVGLAAVAGYSAAVFDTWFPGAGYDVPGHLGGLVEHDLGQTVRAVVGVLVGDRGVLRFSPVVAIAAVAAIRHRRDLHPWAIAAALGGLAYLLVQVRAVGPLGGSGFFGPRVTTEPVVLAVPALVTGAVLAARTSRGWRAALVVAVAVSVTVNAVGAIRGGGDVAQRERWQQVDRSVRDAYGDLRLGEVDLRSEAPGSVVTGRAERGG